MISIDGVGSYKLKHYCPKFLEIIHSYKAVYKSKGVVTISVANLTFTTLLILNVISIFRLI